MSLRIFGYGWHCGHQHDLLSALHDVQFFYMKNRIKPTWTLSNRPWPKNLQEVTKYEPGQYDLAILHIDQQCLFGHPKGIPFLELDKQIQDIPKIVINHATPHYQDYPMEALVRQMKEKVGKNTMVVNSKEAREQWGFGETIIHGMEASEWWDLPDKKLRIVTTLSPGRQDGDLRYDGWAEYYGRQMYDEIRKRIGDRIPMIHIGKDITFNSWDEYRRYIGESMIYLHPGIHSPMPRSRTEAMLSGACVITTPYHGASSFIRNGQNGFLFESTEEAVEIIERLLKMGPGTIQGIGLSGKDTAEEFFNRERYRADWLRLIGKVLREHGTLKEVQILESRLKEIVEMIRVGAEAGKPISAQGADTVLRDILDTHARRLLERETEAPRAVQGESGTGIPV